MEPLIQALKTWKSAGHVVPLSVLWALGQIGDPRAIEELVEAFASPSHEIRAAAAEALGLIRDARAVGPLVAALQDQHYSVSNTAAKALVEIGSPSVDVLIATLQNQDRGKAHFRAALALGQIGDARAIDSLATALFDYDYSVHEQAARALLQILKRTKDSRAVGSLTMALGQDWLVSRTAAEALVEIGNPSVDLLITALQDQETNARYQAAWALGQIRDTRAIRPLITTGASLQ